MAKIEISASEEFDWLKPVFGDFRSGVEASLVEVSLDCEVASCGVCWVLFSSAWLSDSSCFFFSSSAFLRSSSAFFLSSSRVFRSFSISEVALSIST